MLELEKVAKNYRKDYVLGFIQGSAISGLVSITSGDVHEAEKWLNRILEAIKELEAISREQNS